jgi:ABC-2 type transport system permease protein
MNFLRVYRSGLSVGICDFGVFWTNWKAWVAGWILRVSTASITWVLLGRLLDSPVQVAFLLIGQAVIVGPQAAGWAATTSSWERMEGTYAFLVVSPSSIIPSILGRSSIWLLNGIATSLTTFVILVAVFRMPLPMPEGLLAPVLLIPICASAWAFAFLLGAVVIRVPRLRNFVHNIASITLTAICGVAVPIAFWPDWVRYAAHVLPVTHGLQAMRLLLGDGGMWDIATGIALEMLVGTAWLGLGMLVVDRLAEAGRADGSIEFTNFS